MAMYRGIIHNQGKGTTAEAVYTSPLHAFYQSSQYLILFNF
jgi:hypothetical protein